MAKDPQQYERIMQHIFKMVFTSKEATLEQGAELLDMIQEFLLYEGDDVSKEELTLVEAYLKAIDKYAQDFQIPQDFWMDLNKEGNEIKKEELRKWCFIALEEYRFMVWFINFLLSYL